MGSFLTGISWQVGQAAVPVALATTEITGSAQTCCYPSGRRPAGQFSAPAPLSPAMP